MSDISSKPRLLLHTCCATCSGFLASRLAADYEVSLFYYNPNIYPDTEYVRRRDEAKKFFSAAGYEFIEIPPDHGNWLELVKGWELEPERGKRCEVCYRERLAKTAQYAQNHGYDLFASTLAISPHKDAKLINRLGQELSGGYGVGFLAGDWKKQDGFRQAMAISREHDFYRQSYCGCEYSRLEK